MGTGILLSGGIDSAALARWKQPDVALTINYGQRSALGEIRAAKKITEELSIAHEVVSVDLQHLGSGDLAGTPPSSLAPAPEWWPFRNQMLATIAAMRAIALGIDTLLFGAVATDNVHADGRPAFFALLDQLTSMQEGGIRVSAPAIGMTTLELVRCSGIDLHVLAWCHSCHTADFACGNCRGCFKYESIMYALEREYGFH